MTAFVHFLIARAVQDMRLVAVRIAPARRSSLAASGLARRRILSFLRHHARSAFGARLGAVLLRFSTLKNVRMLILPLVIVSFFSDIALACPMCRDLLENGKDAWQALRFGRGIAWSMLLMFSVPFLLVGGMVFVLVRANRRTMKNK